MIEPAAEHVLFLLRRQQSRSLAGEIPEFREGTMPLNEALGCCAADQTTGVENPRETASRECSKASKKTSKKYSAGFKA